MIATLRRRYVDTPDGQLHLTEAGEGRAIVLLPWFPLSARFYADELPVFAELGWRAIAVDPMGQGQSGRREPGWSIPRHADAVAAALAALGLERPVILGGHMGGRIAIALAGRADLAVPALVLDGGLMMPPAVVARLDAQMPPPSDPGAPSALYDKALTALQALHPGFTANARTRGRIQRLMADIIDAGVPPGPDVAPGFDPAARLAELAIPVLALTAETDPLRPTYQPTLDSARNGRGHIFAGGHPLHDIDRIGEYARTVDSLLAAMQPA